MRPLLTFKSPHICGVTWKLAEGVNQFKQLPLERPFAVYCFAVWLFHGATIFVMCHWHPTFLGWVLGWDCGVQYIYYLVLYTYPTRRVYFGVQCRVLSCTRCYYTDVHCCILFWFLQEMYLLLFWSRHQKKKIANGSAWLCSPILCLSTIIYILQSKVSIEVWCMICNNLAWL